MGRLGGDPGVVTYTCTVISDHFFCVMLPVMCVFIIILICFTCLKERQRCFLSVVHCSVQATAESEPSQSLELELHFDLPCGSRSPRT